MVMVKNNNNFRRGMSASWSLGVMGYGSPFAPAVFVEIQWLHVQDRHLWIWIYPWISTQKSVDMDMDIDGKFHIHGKPDFGVHTAWRKARDRDTWHQVVSTATLC